MSIAAEYLRRRRVHRITAGVLLAAVLGFALLARLAMRGYVADSIADVAFYVTAAILVGGAFFDWRRWRCPQCDVWLRGQTRATSCPACNARFR